MLNDHRYINTNQAIDDNYELGSLGLQNYSTVEPLGQRQPIQIVITSSYNGAEENEPRSGSGEPTKTSEEP